MSSRVSLKCSGVFRGMSGYSGSGGGGGGSVVGARSAGFTTSAGQSPFIASQTDPKNRDGGSLIILTNRYQ